MLKRRARNNLKKVIKKVILLNKKEGETPLEAVSLFRNTHKAYKDMKMTYAGRLDPMASGLLLVLAGEETKQKEKYLGLDKEYEFEVLFGFATDTYDILGKVIHSHILENFGMLELKKNIKQNLKFFKGKIKQKYPMYSSKTVNGKQLWQYGREGEEVKIPEREVEVKSLKFLKLKSITGKKLLSDIEKRIKKVNGPASTREGLPMRGGDFRQEEILKLWRKELKKEESKTFFLGGFKMKCSSGTYVRTIANTLGDRIGIPALAYSIKRTKIGKYAKIS